MDRESIRDGVLVAYQQSSDAVVEFVVELVAQLEGLSTRVVALEAENSALRARLNTNSRNSSKPPSSDGPGVKPHPKSQRTRSGRKPGGQPGHVGHTLRLIDKPDEIQIHAPLRCEACGQNLKEVPAIRQERRQVVDIPPVKARVIEHQVEVKCCSGCGAEMTGRFPEGVEAPVQYGTGVATVAVYLNQQQLLPLERSCEVLADLFNCPISEGTLEKAVGKCYEQLAEAEAAIKGGIEEARVAHFDETGMKIAAKTSWLHVASTASLTFYATHQKRGCEALDEIGVLPRFRGRAVHDGLRSYWRYTHCEHGLCNAHHLRELTFVEEELGQSWAKDVKELLLEIKQAVEVAKGQGLAELTVGGEGGVRGPLRCGPGVGAEDESASGTDGQARSPEARQGWEPGGSAAGTQRGNPGLHGGLRGPVRQQSSGARHPDDEGSPEDLRLLPHDRWSPAVLSDSGLHLDAAQARDANPLRSRQGDRRQPTIAGHHLTE